MSDVAIVGVGVTPFVKRAEDGITGLGRRAVRQAIDDAGVAPQDVDVAFCGSVGGGPAIGQRVLKDVAMAGIPITNVENACASGSTAVFHAISSIRAGVAECALAVGVELLSPVSGPLPLPDTWVSRTGLNLIGWYALKARRHMTEHGLTREQLARVMVKSRQYAAGNPIARYRERVTVEEVLASPVIADPLTLLQCCPKVDGAAAAVLCSRSFAEARGLTPIWVESSSMASGRHVFTDDPMAVDTASRAARLAWERSSADPADLDVAEVHDAFTIGEILYMEALGICPLGDGGKYVEVGSSSLGGNGTWVNPSGGLLSRGHPLGASGIAQLAEVVWQLRGASGARQHPNARLGAVHTMGASEFELDANACVVFVLAR